MSATTYSEAFTPEHIPAPEPIFSCPQCSHWIPEGTLAWHDVDTVLDLPMWDGDRHFLPLVFDESVPQFHGVLPYDGGHSVESAWRVSYL